MDSSRENVAKYHKVADNLMNESKSLGSSSFKQMIISCSQYSIDKCYPLRESSKAFTSCMKKLKFGCQKNIDSFGLNVEKYLAKAKEVEFTYNTDI